MESLKPLTTLKHVVLPERPNGPKMFFKYFYDN